MYKKLNCLRKIILTCAIWVAEGKSFVPPLEFNHVFADGSQCAGISCWFSCAVPLSTPRTSTTWNAWKKDKTFSRVVFGESRIFVEKFWVIYSQNMSRGILEWTDWNALLLKHAEFFSPSEREAYQGHLQQGPSPFTAEPSSHSQVRPYIVHYKCQSYWAAFFYNHLIKDWTIGRWKGNPL